MTSLAVVLRSIANRLPDVEQGIACKGTSLESVTWTVCKKAFLFLGPSAARLKLGPSLAEAKRLASKQPGIEVGAGGWVKLALDAEGPPAEVLERWVAESHAGYAGAPVKPAKPKAKSKQRR